MEALILCTSDISPYGQRVAIQLEYKGLPFKSQRPPGGGGSEAFRQLNPLLRVPVLMRGGVAIPESEVICELVEDLFPCPTLRPEDPLDRARARLISRTVDLYVMGPMTPLFRNLSRRGRDEAVVASALAAISFGMDGLERWLSGSSEFAIGRGLTLADCAAAPVLLHVERYPPIFGLTDPLGARPALRRYFDKVREQPVIAKALARIEDGWAALQNRP
jgi:glutathione S-transferase